MKLQLDPTNAKVVLSQLFYVNQDDLKRLTPADRRLCFAALNALVGPIEVDLPKGRTLEQRAIEIKLRLSKTEVSPPQLSRKECVVTLALQEQIERLSTRIMRNCWKEYQEEFCKTLLMHSHGFIEPTRIYLLLDLHKDHLQRLFAQTFVEVNSSEENRVVFTSDAADYVKDPSGRRTRQKCITFTDAMDDFLATNPVHKIFVLAKSSLVWGFEEYNRQMIKSKSEF